VPKEPSAIRAQQIRRKGSACGPRGYAFFAYLRADLDLDAASCASLAMARLPVMPPFF